MRFRSWRVLAVVGVVGVIIAAVFFFAHRSAPSVADAAASAGAPDVPLARAKRGSYQARVRAQGRVGAPSGSEAKLSFANAGIVARIDVHVGEAVVAGEPLAELDSSGIAIDLRQARSDAAAAAASYGGGTVPSRAVDGALARLAAARDRLRALQNGTGTAQSDRASARAAVVQSEGKVTSDQRALDRQTTLYAGGVAALKDVEAARAQLDFDRADAAANRSKAASSGATIGAALTQARADVAQARSDVLAAQAQIGVTGAQASSAGARADAAQRNLALATLRATSDGVIIAVLKHVGEAVDPTQPALVVGPPSTSSVTLLLGGGDAGQVAIGDRVAMRLPSRGNAGIGTVRSVVPSVDPATQTTTIVIAGVPRGAVPGDAVEATIDVGLRHGIVIPTSAIVEDPQTGKALVFVRERQSDGSLKFVSREIVVAAGDEATSLVQRGLSDGDPIAAQGAFDLLAPSGGG